MRSWLSTMSQPWVPPNLTLSGSFAQPGAHWYLWAPSPIRTGAAGAASPAMAATVVQRLMSSRARLRIMDAPGWAVGVGGGDGGTTDRDQGGDAPAPGRDKGVRVGIAAVKSITQSLISPAPP